MVQAKTLYIKLRDDPDLEIPEGDSRESAAWNETAQRVRQHSTNAKALAMGTESSVEKLLDFIEKGLVRKPEETWEQYKNRVEESHKYKREMLARHSGMQSASIIEADIEAEENALSVVSAGTEKEQKEYMRTGGLSHEAAKVIDKPRPAREVKASLDKYEKEIKEAKEAKEREANKLTPVQQEIADKVRALNPREVGSVTAREGKNIGTNTHNIISVEIDGQKVLFARQVKPRPDSGKTTDVSPYSREFAEDRSITIQGPANETLRRWMPPHIDSDTGEEHTLIPDELARQLKETPKIHNSIVYFWSFL